MKKVYIKSEKFNNLEVFELKEKKNGVLKLKWYKHECIIDSVLGTTAISAEDTGNDVRLKFDDIDITFDYCQVERLRIMLNVLAEKEDPTVKQMVL